MSDGAFVWMDGARPRPDEPARVSVQMLLERLEALSERMAELEQEQRGGRRLLALPLRRYVGEWLRVRPAFAPLLAAADALRTLRISWRGGRSMA